MQKGYVYRSVFLHAAVFLLCVADIPFFSSKRQFDEQPPIIVDLENITISDKTNIPEAVVKGEEKKPATRKEKPVEETFTPKETTPPPAPEPVKEEPKAEPVIETPEIKTPSLIEEAPHEEKVQQEPKKESEEPKKEKKKPAPIPQKKPQVKPAKKPEPKKKPDTNKKNDTPKAPQKNKPALKNTNPLQSLMNSVDDLQKQIGTEDAPAQIPHNEPVNNMGIEGGTSNGSYFSELSVSGIDFVKSKIQESWKTVFGGKEDRSIEVIIKVELAKDGGISSIVVENPRSDTYFQAISDSAERAIIIAQETYNVFGVLARQNSASYNDWKRIRFTFTPLGLSK